MSWAIKPPKHHGFSTASAKSSLKSLSCIRSKALWRISCGFALFPNGFMGYGYVGFTLPWIVKGYDIPPYHHIDGTSREWSFGRQELKIFLPVKLLNMLWPYGHIIHMSTRVSSSKRMAELQRNNNNRPAALPRVSADRAWLANTSTGKGVVETIWHPPFR